MKKIDRRRKYYCVLDTETCNTFKNDKGQLEIHSALVYDIGFAIVDKKGNVYDSGSYIVEEVFFDMGEAMTSAYYIDKCEKYVPEIENGSRRVENLWTIRHEIISAMEDYGVENIIAHNARFDYCCLNSSLRYLYGSFLRYFFPKDYVWWDSLKMARSVILHMPTYRQFCEKHNLLTKNGRLSASAENLYKFISNNPDFEESHTGLEDVLIEKEIFAKCMKQRKPMNKLLWNN